MKRRDIIKKLEAAGLTLIEGSNHTKIYRGTKFISAISRRREIADKLVISIEKQTGVPLRSP